MRPRSMGICQSLKVYFSITSSPVLRQGTPGFVSHAGGTTGDMVSSGKGAGGRLRIEQGRAWFKGQGVDHGHDRAGQGNKLGGDRVRTMQGRAKGRVYEGQGRTEGRKYRTGQNRGSSGLGRAGQDKLEDRITG